jgi:hypothetical protein
MYHCCYIEGHVVVCKLILEFIFSQLNFKDVNYIIKIVLIVYK